MAREPDVALLMAAFVKKICQNMNKYVNNMALSAKNWLSQPKRSPTPALDSFLPVKLAGRFLMTDIPNNKKYKLEFRSLILQDLKKCLKLIFLPAQRRQVCFDLNNVTHPN